MTLEIIGAGFGRTSTMSLKHALERLGFGPCYHMLEVSENLGHNRRWLDAVEGRPVDWDALFARYRSAVDWPVCHFWRELTARYPDARVVLSVRDAGDWYESLANTILPALDAEPDPADEDRVVHRAMARKLIWERTFDGRHRDREHAIGVFHAHVEAVRREIPASRLLVYEVGSGWAPLCEFLGVPVPDEPYPSVNSTAEFREQILERPAS